MSLEAVCFMKGGCPGCWAAGLLAVKIEIVRDAGLYEVYHLFIHCRSNKSISLMPVK